jgi:hypothetical protein
MHPHEPDPDRARESDRTPPAAPAHYTNYRCPSEILSHGVWRYARFPFIPFVKWVFVAYSMLKWFSP